ncbi:MAG: DUF6090 family protein [Algibacter sp.]
MGIKFLNILKIAVGEIVMVVIGILLALQINNWNEEQKIEIEEMSILENLLDNLKSAKGQSENFITQEEKLKQSLLLALEKSTSKYELNLNSITDSIFYELLWNFEEGVPVINSYSDLKNTGKVTIIKNADIRKHFNNLELNINGLRFFTADRLAVQQLRVDDIAINNINFVRLLNVQDSKFNIDNESTNDYRSILANPKTRNALATKLELTNKVIHYRHDLGIEINNLIDRLQVEIISRKGNEALTVPKLH